ncbi:hypothetical protein RSAG8_08281, partial [Rhizoctonia solani AG-8 WAC10335]
MALPSGKDGFSTKRKVLRHVKSAYDVVIQTYNTANAYFNGLSEIIIGKAIKQHKLPRDEIVIMTKDFYPVPEYGMDGAEPGGTDEQLHLQVRQAFSRASPNRLCRCTPVSPLRLSPKPCRLCTTWSRLATHTIPACRAATLISFMRCKVCDFVQAYSAAHATNQSCKKRPYGPLSNFSHACW